MTSSTTSRARWSRFSRGPAMHLPGAHELVAPGLNTTDSNHSKRDVNRGLGRRATHGRANVT